MHTQYLKSTSRQRQCVVMTSHRRQLDVISAMVGGKTRGNISKHKCMFLLTVSLVVFLVKGTLGQLVNIHMQLHVRDVSLLFHIIRLFTYMKNVLYMTCH